ncbi:MAG: SEL1-like repeat protein [Gammaproteobacteria bacterium]|nr:SEL1-like repeat protein [Gammaproteobacteria bacterium]MBU1505909.1 SEL1-like repeat protein [Gammaproteobacteria bacterium]MBU2123539.1 SEL1-like repeat protein [Gammaproteobacteria bacterium]MBU2172497.1 SEL1-like repeat protein [Gammaproteobacteria bacterium]MBU2201955.1 SEL1-like repeat protein [Gammaproteobacteria bacterium]
MNHSLFATPATYQQFLDPVVLSHANRRWVINFMELLNARRFEALQALVQPQWLAFEGNTLSDWGLELAWPHLDLRRSDLLEPAAAWAQAYPQSFAAQIFAARLQCSVAWEARGTATSDRTSEKQFAVMQQHFDAAYPYLHRALGLSSRPTLAIAVGLAMTRAGQNDPSHDYEELAQGHLPHSPLLYRWMMWALQPKWGGSTEAMSSLFEAAKGWGKSWNEHDRAQVQIRYDDEMADVAACSGEPEHALEMLRNIARSAPDQGAIHSHLASRYNANDDTHLAIDHMLQAVKIAPAAQRLYPLGNYFHQIGRTEQSLAYLEESMLWGSGAAAGDMMESLRDQFSRASPGDRPMWEAQITEVARHGLQQYSSDTMFVLGCIEYFHRDDAQAKHRAYGWWQQAADWGHSVAMFNLGVSHFDGDDGLPVNKSLGLDLLNQAAAQGSWKANRRLGHLYLHGDGVQQDDVRAAYHLEFAAEGEDVRAMREWVFCLWFGRGTPKDRDAANAILDRLKVLDPDEYKRARDEIGWGAAIKNIFRNLLP